MRKEYGTLIRTCRSNLGLNQAELAEKIGVSRNAVAGWETGHSRPDLGTLPMLCDALGISLETFFGTETPRGEEERRLVKVFFSLEERDREALFWQMEAVLAGRRRQREGLVGSALPVAGRPETPGVKPGKAATGRCKTVAPRYVKIYASELSAAAGVSAGLDEARGETVYLLADRETESADEIITVNGESMEPTFLDGDRVLVRRTERIRPGEIGIFLADGEGYIKEYQPDGLHSHNPAYGVMRFGEGQDVRCMGVVIGKVKAGQIPDERERQLLEEAERAGEGGNEE